MIKQIETNRSKTALIFRVLFFCAGILLPATGLYFGLDYFARNQTVSDKNAITVELNTVAAEIALAADQEKFWIKELSNLFSISETTGELKTGLESLIKRTDVEANYIIYDNTGNHLRDNIKDDVMAEKWRNAGKALNAILNCQYGRDSFILSKQLAETFGPDFFLPLMRIFLRYSANELYKSDSINPKFLYWSAFSKEIFLLFRLPAGEMKKRTGLRLYLEQNRNKKINAALFLNNKLYSSDFSALSAKLAFNKFQKDFSHDLLEQDDCLIKPVQIGNSLWLLLNKKLPEDKFKPGQLTLLLTMLSLLLLALMIRSGFLPSKPEDLPLMAQIIILLAVTAGIPMGSLGLIGFSYFSSKQQIIVNENFHRMRSYIEYLKSQVQIEHARIKGKVEKAVKKHSDILKSDLDQIDELHGFNRSLERMVSNGYFVKNNQFTTIGGRRNRATNQNSQQDNNPGGMDRKKIERSNSLLIGNYFLSSLNETKKPDIPLEKAYMMEMFFQKPLPMLMNELLTNEGIISSMGWGNQKIFLFNQAFNLLNTDEYDLYVFLMFTPSIVEKIFFDRYIHSIQQNPYGYRIFIANDLRLLNEDASLAEFPEENQIMSLISSNQQTEPRIVSFYGQPHLFYGQTSPIETKDLRFCAVFPMEKIIGVIQKEAEEFIFLAVAAVIVICTMIVVLYLNLIMPVKKLHEAAEALEERNSGFRLSTENKDEFGEMAEIFNQSISELEELNIASLVQARLLPALPLKSDAFNIYGKSVPMADLGGDYFDYFNISSNSFAMMLGDVAGHGVGAALIMAIAKAGVIVSEELSSDPAAILTKLHQIILATKTRQQRKVMTFQYLVVDKPSRKITYANAGGCSPALIDSTKNTVTEIKHGGGVLGGFKKNNISNIEFSIEPGQAVIFYTDGMVESRNHTGRELGYQGLYEIFLTSYKDDAEDYYKKINETYNIWLNGSEAGDDLTILIMTCGRADESTDGPV